MDERQEAVRLFNATWELIEAPERTPDDDLRMVHMAHASRYHWEQVGEPVNLARGEWQCSRVYAVLRRSEPARYHAENCLRICRANSIGDFDLAYAYEALARAEAVAGGEEASKRWRAEALAAAEAIADPEDRAHFLEDLASI